MRGKGQIQGPQTMSKKKEVVKQKSPAEFFAENQIIAGFDNPGKSLYTSIRELVENSLDAAESIGVLPDINVEINELSETQFNKRRGVSNVRDDTGLFRTGSVGSKKKAADKEDTQNMERVRTCVRSTYRGTDNSDHCQLM